MSKEYPFTQIAIRLNPRDPLAIAKQEIAAGSVVRADRPGLPFQALEIHQHIPAGHKFALAALDTGQEICRYGQRIGVAAQPILPGDWIHSHNLSVGDMSRAFDIQVVQGQAAEGNGLLHFNGYQRANGQVGTRNYVAVVSTVSCATQTARALAQAFPAEALTDFPNVDGVIAITHSLGCCAPIGGFDFQNLQRTLLNLARHPNVGGIVYVSLGCESNQMSDLVEKLRESGDGSCLVGPFLTIQEVGGIEKTTRAGVAAIREMLPRVNAIPRTLVSASHLKVALQCGGSDGWSGVTANPLVGQVADRIVACGGTVVLAETPEIYGAEQLLLKRVVSEAAGQKLIARIRWWQAQAALLGFSLDNNPSPGNKAGGLTTIFEKSLGAVAKGGSTPLMDVVEYGEWITSQGLVFMDTPGYDPVSVTGQIAGGCNLTLFTTGRGSVFGGNLAPCIKVATHSALYQHMISDMDFDAGTLLNGERSLEEAADQLLTQVLQAASGGRTKSEHHGMREAEFVPWHTGVML